MSTLKFATDAAAERLVGADRTQFFAIVNAVARQHNLTFQQVQRELSRRSADARHARALKKYYGL